MAIYSSVPPPAQQVQVQVQSQASPSAVEAWTVSALQSLSVSPSARGTGVTLGIPLDSDYKKPVVYKARVKEPVRRDSQKRREALLKGKEGSRRRQRWENDIFLHVPNAQPPLPSDWEVHPTYPVHTVPYYLAPLWDAGIKHRAEEKRTTNQTRAGISSDGKGRVPTELRQKLKKSKGAKSLLMELEEEIRKFVSEYERQSLERGTGKGNKGEMEMDSEDEEIVFIGRDKSGVTITMSDEDRGVVEEELQRERKVWDSLEGDKGGSFGRWLVHSIAGYYGLSSRSVTVGERRESYVGVRIRSCAGGGKGVGVRVGGELELPRPLWGMI